MHREDDRERGSKHRGNDVGQLSADEPRSADEASGPPNDETSRSNVPERGRQGFPGSPEERFGPGGFDEDDDHSRAGREELERRGYAPRDVDPAQGAASWDG